MRRRIIRALVAVAAAGATIITLGFTAATAASASVAGQARPAALQAIGPTVATINAAGYEASGRYFRYVQSVITVPDWHSSIFWPQEYIQLSNGSLNNTGVPTGDQFTRAGIEACVVAHHQGNVPGYVCHNHRWVAFVQVFRNSIFHPYAAHFVPLRVHRGDGVFFSIYYNQWGNELHFVIRPPTEEACWPNGVPASACYYETRAYGPIYTSAAALTDFLNSSGQPFPLPPWGHKFRINQFLQGALTTYTGHRGSFVGPWSLSKVEATSNGEPYPYGHVRVSPGYLWTDGLTGRPFDAFGVWARV